MALPLPLHHAAVGNGRLLGLVGPDGSLDWLCFPRMDAPTLFARLLDEAQGGRFQITPAAGPVHGMLSYVRNTNVARLVVHADDGSYELFDFAPRIPDGLAVRAPVEHIRLLRPLQGRPRVRIRFDPRPDYGRQRPRLHDSGSGLVLDDGTGVHLATNVPHAHLVDGRPHTLDAPAYFVVQQAGAAAAPVTMPRVLHDLDATIGGWRQWARTCALPSFAGEAVLRSALVLKLHVVEDTGAILAAATTSIPEALGTPRTWDYRYCWLRDAAFAVEVLRRLGHVAEGEAFVGFLRDVAADGPLQPVYALDGRRQLDEVFLPHLAGFAGNGHVRIGNAAWHQRQHDIYGELLLALHALHLDPRCTRDLRDDFPMIRTLVHTAAALAGELDTGIWEFRTLLRPYTFSRAMCWVALDRGARLAARMGEPGLAAEWAARADVEREEILRRAWRPDLGIFTQALDGEFPDASNLLLPSLGLLPADDPRFRSTLAHYAVQLGRQGLLLRYAHPDDFGDTTSAFTLCSFWWSLALAQAGDLDAAIAVFERLLSHANPLGLFSEDIEPATGLLLGNFPQAYTHVGLIHAAMTIGSRLDARDGHLLAWR